MIGISAVECFHSADWRQERHKNTVYNYFKDTSLSQEPAQHGQQSQSNTHHCPGECGLTDCIMTLKGD